MIHILIQISLKNIQYVCIRLFNSTSKHDNLNLAYVYNIAIEICKASHSHYIVRLGRVAQAA